MTKIFYVDMFLSHSVKLFESLLELSKDKNLELKFLGPDKEFPYPNSNVIKYVEKIWSDNHYVRKLYRYLKCKRPDIVHITFEPRTFGSLKSAFKLPLLLFLIHNSKIKIVFTLRNIVIYQSNGRWVLPDYIPFKIPAPIMKILLKIFIKIICNLCDKIIVETGEGKSGLVEFYKIDEKKINVILYIGTSTKIRPINSEKKEKLIKQFQGKKIVLYFGVISPRKGHHAAIKSFKILSNALPDYILVISGSASEGFESYEAMLHEMVKEFNLEKKVFFTGYVDYDEVDALFDMSEMALFVYRQMSASPGAVVFALEHKVPCIVSKSPSFEEIFGSDGAIFVEEDDETKLANTIQLVANDQKLRDMLKSKMSIIANNLTWRNLAAKHLAVYDGVPRS